MSSLPAPHVNGKVSNDDGPKDGWLARPVCGWGLLVIRGTCYSVHEVEYTEEDGTPRMYVRLRKADGTEYQVVPTPESGRLDCDCGDQTFRGDRDPDHRCKHIRVLTDAYAAIERDRRLSDFVAGTRGPCPECNGRGERYCKTCDGIGEVPLDDPVVALISEGWCRGALNHLLPAVVQVDADSAARMKCGHCRRKGMLFQAWHRGRSYAATATCPACHFTEQV
jgi:hypothetical protein